MKTIGKILFATVMLAFRAPLAHADIHLIQIDELMAGLNGDATIQFVQLKLLATDQKCQGTGNIIDFTNHLCDGVGPGAKLVFFNAQGVQTGEFIFPSNTPLGDAGRSILIATQQFVNLSTVPVPDFIMPPNVVPISGKVCYRNQEGAPFTVNVCLSYGNFTGSTEGFGNPAAALPIDNAQSLRRVSETFDNSFAFTLGTPAPRNNAGNCGSVFRGNNCPKAFSQDVITLEETPVGITLGAADLDGDPLIFTLVRLPANGSLTGTLPNLIYTPRLNFSGTDNFTFKVNDGVFDSNPATVSITVTGVNDPPRVFPLTIRTAESVPVNIFLSAFDVDNDRLVFRILTSPSNGVLSGTAPNLFYKPNANFIGMDSFTYNVSDGLVDSDTVTVFITVTANLPPTALGQSVAAISGKPRSIILEAFDPEHVPLIFEIATPPRNGFLSGTPPKISYTSNSGFLGSDNFTFIVNDGRQNSNIATVTIDVTPPCAIASIGFGETKAGELANTDCIAPSRPGRFADLFSFIGFGGQRIRIGMDAAFDTFLILQDPAGNMFAQNDNCIGAGINSCIPFDAVSGGAMLLPFTGTYAIEATSLLSAATGAYTIKLESVSLGQPFMLTVRKSGNGVGTVRSSNIPGIDCGSDCSEPVPLDSSVVLTAAPDLGSRFAGWFGNRCVGTRFFCFLNISGETSITAAFEALPLVIDASSTLPDAEPNLVYNANLRISGGVQPYIFQFLNGSLPAGLTVDSQGVITGSPISTRSSTFTLQVKDQNGSAVSKTFSIKLYKPISITTRRLRASKVGLAYNATLKGTGGKTSYSWSHQSDMPSWLSLDTATGQLTGIPPIAGTFTLTFNLVDALGGQAQKTLTLVVN